MNDVGFVVVEMQLSTRKTRVCRQDAQLSPFTAEHSGGAGVCKYKHKKYVIVSLVSSYADLAGSTILMVFGAARAGQDPMHPHRKESLLWWSSGSAWQFDDLGWQFDYLAWQLDDLGLGVAVWRPASLGRRGIPPESDSGSCVALACECHRDRDAKVWRLINSPSLDQERPLPPPPSPPPLGPNRCRH